jgi:hypothetical protein
LSAGSQPAIKAYSSLSAILGIVQKEAAAMKKYLVLMYLLLGVFLTACSNAGAPDQIAVYSMEKPIAVYPHPPESTLIYNATLDMEVSDVERAAERAQQIAFEAGGYLISAQSWYRDGEKHSTMVLAVPVYRFDLVRENLLRLGKLSGEWISSELTSPGSSTSQQYSQITVYFHPRESRLPKISLPNFHPLNTIERAFGVFASIFGFILDILIWIIIVVGPFILIGLGIRRLVRWWITKYGTQKT